MTHVLMVGEDAFLLAYAKARLEQDCGIHVTTALSAAAAQSELKSRPFDVIVVDHASPSMERLQFPDIMKEAHRDVPVIFCSRQNRRDSPDGFSFNGTRILLHKSDDMDLFCDDLAEILHCIRGEYGVDERHYPPVSASSWIERIFLV
ncbi:MAG TPA: response regulator [Methanoculleus sp.]|nr:response regulator [Methanoculleus sp.]